MSLASEVCAERKAWAFDEAQVRMSEATRLVRGNHGHNRKSRSITLVVVSERHLITLFFVFPLCISMVIWILTIPQKAKEFAKYQSLFDFGWFCERDRRECAACAPSRPI